MTLKNIYSSENLLIDRALVVFFDSSHSYNKEDIF
jgi:tRNA U34 5-carboxymethylaminomethyl modifying GTPase MnmE/TrmE